MRTIGAGRTLVCVLIALILCAGAVRDIGRLKGASPFRNMVDLSVFYCGGEALRLGSDPYDPSSIRACEHRINRGKVWDDPQHVMYAPLPPFDFLPYAALSQLSFALARWIVFAFITLAVVVTALALQKLGVPWYVALAALALSDGFIGMYLGQLYPFTIALVAIAAAALHRGRDGLAGLAAAATLVEPQIGAFVCVALFVSAPRSRVTLAVSTLVLIALGAVALGPSSLVRWLTYAVPLQARSETHFWGQYSLTTILGQVGVHPSLAMALGSASTIILLCAGVYLGRRVSLSLQARSAIVFVPAACSVMGGTYVHLGAIAVALLATLSIAAARPQSTVLPLAALCIPWPFVQDIKALFLSAIVVLAIALFGLRGLTKQTVAILLVFAGAMYVLGLHPPPDLIVGSSPLGGGEIDRWRIIPKIPTFIALLALFYAFVRLAVDRPKLSGFKTSTAAAPADIPYS